MSKKISKYTDVEDIIVTAVDKIADPVRQTLGPKGGNVLFEDASGIPFVTNDGVTIADNINSPNPEENIIINTIKHSASRTNVEAGDGTSTTILLSSVLIKGGLKMIRDGHNQMDVKRELDAFGVDLKDSLFKTKKKIKNEQDLTYIAKISANNDSEIAENVVKIVDVAGQHGQIMIDPSFSGETSIKNDTGFVMNSGMLLPDLEHDASLAANYRDVPVLVTDKRIYYRQEAETILNTVLEAGYKDVVIVASDFVGEALPFFVSNHKAKTINILLVKDNDASKNNGVSLDDLAIYLGGEGAIAEKSGNIVNKLTIENFFMAKRAYSNEFRTVLVGAEEKQSKKLKTRINGLKDALKTKGDKESVEYKGLERRLASLTTGMVSIAVGGGTAIEVKEKIYRYEDAINATRASLKYGYLVGGGIAILNAYKSLGKDYGEFTKLFKQFAEANVSQLAENAGLYPETVLEVINIAKAKNLGYNALTGTYEDLLKAGIVDPYRVTELAIDNSISIAGAILSSRYLITNIIKDDKSN